MPTRVVLCLECGTIQKNKTQCGICGHKIDKPVESTRIQTERWGEAAEESARFLDFQDLSNFYDWKGL